MNIPSSTEPTCFRHAVSAPVIQSGTVGSDEGEYRRVSARRLPHRVVKARSLEPTRLDVVPSDCATPDGDCFRSCWKGALSLDLAAFDGR